MKPNVLFVLADQWRQQATCFAGDPNIRTPNLEKLADESLVFTHALSSCPVCSPYRASLLTGQRPLTHGVFVNDVPLNPCGVTLGDAFAKEGYDTGYIGKWHLDGHGRSCYIPPERRLGFQYWKALECTHDYMHSAYYADDNPEKTYWEGYDAIAQTRDAVSYLAAHQSSKQPFFLVLSWGPPHEPYHTAPSEFRQMYDPHTIVLRENVPVDMQDQAREWLAGYYAHCSALDFCIGELMKALERWNLLEKTIFVFTSDHGDMLGSQGEMFKQRPWDESIRVPFLLRLPACLQRIVGNTSIPIDAPDIMPTLLALCGIDIPESVEGKNYANHLYNQRLPYDDAVLLTCPHPFGQWNAVQYGGREYRGLRTSRYTYVRDLHGPWLLYDNVKDPIQMQNLISDPTYESIRSKLDDKLRRKLEEYRDEFLPGLDYIKKWGYSIDETGTVPYTE